MEHMDKSKTGSKQLSTVKGGCPGLVHLVARRDLIIIIRIYTQFNTLEGMTLKHKYVFHLMRQIRVLECII